MQKEIENLESVQCVNFIFVDTLKNNGTKYLLIFDDSREEICNSKAFFNIATAGRHRGLSTIYIEHNLLNQSKLGRDVELQTTHIVLFKSSRDVMQVSTLSAQMGLGSEPVDWYRDATSVHYGHLLIDFSPRTDDRLRYFTNTGSISLNFYIPHPLKQSKSLDDEHTKPVYSPSVPTIFPQLQKSFPSVLPKRVYPVLLRMHSKYISAQRTPAKHKKTSGGKISQPGSIIVCKPYSLEERREILASGIGLQLYIIGTPPVLNHCLDMEQFVLVPASVYNKTFITQPLANQEPPKYQPSQNSTYQIDSVKEEINENLFSKGESLVDKISLVHVSNSQNHKLYFWIV